MRIFGTPVYIPVPKEKRAKLEPFGKKGIFVGYSESSKAYRIYVPGQRYTEFSRDVIFLLIELSLMPPSPSCRAKPIQR